MESKCDVCGTTENITSEVLMKGDIVDRVYHLCPLHWVGVYRRCLDEFLDHNEYKVNSYIKLAADRQVVDYIQDEKVSHLVNEEGVLDIEVINPDRIRKLRSFGEDRDEPQL